jgi:phosphomevalonate kinase
MTAVSAPGKVLLAGGYLVLDRAYTGLVFGLSARIHVVVRDAAHPEIVVESPQFRDASWAYSYHVAGEEGGVDVIQVPGYENRAASAFLRLTTSSCCTPAVLALLYPSGFLIWSRAQPPTSPLFA